MPIGSPPTGTRAATSRVGELDCVIDGVPDVDIGPGSPPSPPHAAKTTTHDPRTTMARPERDIGRIR
jgi:hypothetical protein